MSTAQREKADADLTHGDIPPWRCAECGKRFTTVRAVEKAQSVGCPKCNSGDIEQAVGK